MATTHMRNIVMSVVFVMSTLGCCSAAPEQEPNTNQPLAEQVVPRFDLENGTMREAVKQLARARTGNFGFEEILRERFTDPSVAGPQISIHLSDVPLGQVLDALCRNDPRYTWSGDGNSVNLYPISTAGDPSYLLNRHIPHVTVQNAPDPDQALFALDKQLPPPKEQLGYTEAGGDNTYTAPWTTSFENVTVRQFVNRISEHIGASTVWFFYGSKQEKLFTFMRMNASGSVEASVGGAKHNCSAVPTGLRLLC